MYQYVVVCPVDPLVAAGSPASAVHRSLTGYGSVPGMPLAPPVSPAAQALLAAQQHELLCRELLSRAPYANDPVLTQQVSQANRSCHTVILCTSNSFAMYRAI